MVKAVFSECQIVLSLQGQLDLVLEVYGVFVKYSSFRAPTEEQLRDTLINSLRNDSNKRRVTALRDAVRKVYSSESNVSCMELQLHDFSLP